jgi:hypothetical protein
MFDLWFDFRKYFTKKNNDEGDMLWKLSWLKKFLH